ncbi:MAG: glycosyltransferase [Planctomycetes bacterium]|nr:glycosyltransferase [Planctomycetota bacterium]
MNSTLGIVVPVRNAEATLRAQIQELLDILPDVASHFRVVIVDDASSDSTDEIAHELATTYPQVDAVRHDPSLGRSAAETGINRIGADLVYVQDQGRPFRIADLNAAVAYRGEPIPTPVPMDSHLMRRLIAWGRALERTEASPGGASASRAGSPVSSPETPSRVVRRSRSAASHSADPAPLPSG